MIRYITESPPLSEVERAISRVLADKADLPRVVTLAVSTVGGLLVIVNIALVACVLSRRRRRKGSQGETRVYLGLLVVVINSFVFISLVVETFCFL